MGYLIKVNRHVCDKPYDGMTGDVWQCDVCKAIYIRSFIGWIRGYQSIDGKYYMLNSKNLEEHPVTKNDKDDE